MMRYKSTIGVAAATFALSLAPAWAQERSRPADTPATGTAVPRDSGSSSGSSSSGSSSSSGGGSSTTSSNGGSSSSSGSWMGNSGYEAPRRAPVNPEAAGYGDQRRGNGGTSTGRAVPRDSAGSGGGSTSSTRSSDGNDRQTASSGNRAVPVYSRPRDGRPVNGTAVERTGGYYGDGGGYSYTTYIYDPYYSYYYSPYYRNRYYWSPWGYGFGFGYMAYDPFVFGGFGYPDYYGNYYDPYFGGGYGGYGYGGGGYSSSVSQVSHGVGSLRLKVKPGHAQVFVDGYLVGSVDSFDGVFQRLSVEGGSHRIELRADGYESTQFEVMVIPGETITYKGEMRRR
jgi:hypothetical protein